MSLTIFLLAFLISSFSLFSVLSFISWGSLLLYSGIYLLFRLTLCLSISPLNLHLLQISLSTILDRVSFVIMFLTFLVIYISLYAAFLDSSLYSLYSLVVLFLACTIFFSTSSLIILYISFEISLLPIRYIILKWGSYQDRCLSVIYILAFTTFFSFPFIIFMLMAALQGSFRAGFYLNASTPLSCPSFWVSLLVFSVFSVKLPIYGLHIWLPIAHVEAPVFGSIVLAGILLKLGGVGLLRTLPLIEASPLFFDISIVIIRGGVILSSLLSCAQSDFKRLVAYLSVVHITVVGILLIFSTSLSISSSTSIIVLHGVLSPIMFFIVNLVYSIFKTRVIFIFYSVKFSRHLFLVLILLSFAISIPTPPFPQFLAEVIAIIRLIRYSLLPMSSLILILTFFSLLINLMWFIPLFSNPTPKTVLSSISISISSLLVLIIFLIVILFFTVNFLFIV